MEPIIALIWDFDNTLIKGCMQDPLFESYHADGAAFWQEKDELAQSCLRQGLRVNSENLYLNLLVQKTREGLFPGLNNRILTDIGTKQRLCPGLPSFFALIKQHIALNPQYASCKMRLEHYIVSNGLAATIRGSILAHEAKAVWGCELADSAEGILDQIVYTVDSTAKTRILFEISKGCGTDSNRTVSPAHWRIPFANMIYIADGQSDIPAFLLVRQGGGRTLGVYHPEQPHTCRQAEQLLANGRVEAIVEADYSPGSAAYQWIFQRTTEIAERLCSDFC